MASKYAASFDELLDNGRRQLDTLTEQSYVRNNSGPSNPGVGGVEMVERMEGVERATPEPARRPAIHRRADGAVERAASADTVIDGTAGGVAFRLTVKS